MAPPVRELVISLFFHYFTVADTSFGHALMSFLPETISTAEDDALSAAISSVGYAIFSNITNSSDELILARQKYGMAVRLTLSTIQSSVTSGTCPVLRVILLLALFEALTCKDLQTMTFYSSHLKGAVTLLEARPVNLSTCALGMNGLKLFLQLRSQILAYCMQQNVPVPDALSQGTNRVKRIMTPDEVLSAELGDIVTRVANFRSYIRVRGSFGPDYFVPILLQMDHDLEKWALTLPSSWRYEIRACAPGEDFYATFYHNYPGFTVASLWNQYRVARCVVDDLLLTRLGSLCSMNQARDAFALLEQFDQAKETAQKLCTDICASIPYFLRQMGEKDVPVPGVGALEVTWALAACASMGCIPEEQRLWVIMQLDRIGHQMGVHQALPLANLMRSKVKLVASGNGFDPTSENYVLASSES